jgi:hypothetical protein
MEASKFYGPHSPQAVNMDSTSLTENPGAMCLTESGSSLSRALPVALLLLPPKYLTCILCGCKAPP